MNNKCFPISVTEVVVPLDCLTTVLETSIKSILKLTIKNLVKLQKHIHYLVKRTQLCNKFKEIWIKNNLKDKLSNRTAILPSIPVDLKTLQLRKYWVHIHHSKMWYLIHSQPVLGQDHKVWKDKGKIPYKLKWMIILHNQIIREWYNSTKKVDSYFNLEWICYNRNNMEKQ